jgi:hypothetical protein
MSTPFELIFDNAVFSAQVVFVGTRCGQENLLRTYASGMLHFVKSSRAQVQAEGRESVAINEPSLVFFPRANRHNIAPAAGESGVELVCAIANFSEAFQQTVVPSLPDMVVLPLAELAPIRHAVEAFFAEAASAAPGSKWKHSSPRPHPPRPAASNWPTSCAASCWRTWYAISPWTASNARPA